MSARLRPDEYFVVTSSRGRPSIWTWEIQSRPKPLGIKLGGADFNSEPGAKLAGEKALIEFLDRLSGRKCPLMPGSDLNGWESTKTPLLHPLFIEPNGRPR
jgi:hypothetical protein